MGRQEGKGGAVVGEGVGGEEGGGVGGEGGFHEERDRRKKVGSDVVRFPNQKHMRRQIRWGCGRQETRWSMREMRFQSMWEEKGLKTRRRREEGEKDKWGR